MSVIPFHFNYLWKKKSKRKSSRFFLPYSNDATPTIIFTPYALSFIILMSLSLFLSILSARSDKNAHWCIHIITSPSFSASMPIIVLYYLKNFSFFTCFHKQLQFCSTRTFKITFLITHFYVRINKPNRFSFLTFDADQVFRFPFYSQTRKKMEKSKID